MGRCGRQAAPGEYRTRRKDERAAARGDGELPGLFRCFQHQQWVDADVKPRQANTGPAAKTSAPPREVMVNYQVYSADSNTNNGSMRTSSRARRIQDPPQRRARHRAW
jgi:hypothetical protein